MRTLDVRILVRGDLSDEEVVDLLRNGALRVHAVAQIVDSAFTVTGDVHYASRCYAQHEWTGETLTHDAARGDARGH